MYTGCPTLHIDYIKHFCGLTQSRIKYILCCTVYKITYVIYMAYQVFIWTFFRHKAFVDEWTNDHCIIWTFYLDLVHLSFKNTTFLDVKNLYKSPWQSWMNHHFKLLIGELPRVKNKNTATIFVIFWKYPKGGPLEK